MLPQSKKVSIPLAHLSGSSSSVTMLQPRASSQLGAMPMSFVIADQHGFSSFLGGSFVLFFFFFLSGDLLDPESNRCWS